MHPLVHHHRVASAGALYTFALVAVVHRAVAAGSKPVLRPSSWLADERPYSARLPTRAVKTIHVIGALGRAGEGACTIVCVSGADGQVCGGGAGGGGREGRRPGDVGTVDGGAWGRCVGGGIFFEMGENKRARGSAIM